MDHHRLAEAFGFAAHLHARQTRKGVEIPYVSHLMSVSALVLEHGGDEDQAIAGLLHDAVEDQGGLETAALIRERFGPRVTQIVMGCTDAVERPGQAKPAWRARKQAFIERLRTGPAEVALVVCADKIHNLRSIIADVEREGPSTLTRFAHPALIGWYYAGVADALAGFPQLVGAAELNALVARYQALVREIALPTGAAADD
jgi:(p)ppGpp synthase/HD superfamily hydrolase